MNRERALVKNTGIIAIGKLSSKVFTFLLLPLYTSTLLPEDYGTIDVLQTVMSLVLYVVTLQIDAAVFRFIIDNRGTEDKKICYVSSGLVLLSVSSVVFTGLLLLTNVFFEIPYLLLFILTYWAHAFANLMLNIARGLGHNAMYSLCSAVITLVGLIANIMLILGMHLGAKSILIAMLISNIVGSLIIVISEKLWKVVSLSSFRMHELKEMLEYSIPLVPNAVSWWITNMSDRILILLLLGSAMNGIYAAANKIPIMYTTIFTIYNLAWSESVVLCVKDRDNEDYINRIMQSSYKLFSFLVVGIICCVSLCFNIIFGSNYNDAYPHIFILLIAVFINSLCSMYGGIFSGFKDTKITGKTTIIGAIINFLVNLFLIKVIGLYAASISTLVAYSVIFFVRKRAANKYVRIVWDRGFSIQLIFIFLAVGVGYFLQNYWVNGCILLGVIVWGILNNKAIVSFGLKMLRGKLVRKTLKTGTERIPK